MNTDKSMMMLVCWGDQRREIEINPKNSISDIEKAIRVSYQLQRMDELHEYQIQYYDSGYRKFMDLYPRSLIAFQQHLRRLSTNGAPSKSSQEWVLKMVARAVRSRSRSTADLLIEDTYNYQVENEPQEFLPTEQSIVIRSSSLPSGSKTDHSEPLPGDSTLQNLDEDEEDAAQSVLPSTSLTTVQAPLAITPDHPYGLSFGRLADHQRQQYIGEMKRGDASKKSTTAGVLLHAYQQSEGTSGKPASYPIVHFHIPSEEHGKSWHLVFHILTETGSNGAHYLHASKGIHLHGVRYEKVDDVMGDTNLVNACIVKLNPEEIRDGQFQVLMKVCNRKDLPQLKTMKLRELVQWTNQTPYDELTLASNNTTCSLNFSPEKYHVSCALICDKKICDQCISNVTMAVPGQKLIYNGKKEKTEWQCKEENQTAMKDKQSLRIIIYDGRCTRIHSNECSRQMTDRAHVQARTSSSAIAACAIPETKLYL